MITVIEEVTVDDKNAVAESSPSTLPSSSQPPRPPSHENGNEKANGSDMTIISTAVAALPLPSSLTSEIMNQKKNNTCFYLLFTF